MTEITAIRGSLLFPTQRTKHHLVDPVAFALAMIGGPLITGILGMPALFIPTFAVMLGGPIYLAVGIPVMLVYMRRHRPPPMDWGLLAFTTHLALFLPIFALAWQSGSNVDSARIYLLFGSFFAPLWGAVSGVIYRRLERDFYKQTI